MVVTDPNAPWTDVLAGIHGILEGSSGARVKRIGDDKWVVDMRDEGGAQVFVHAEPEIDEPGDEEHQVRTQRGLHLVSPFYVAQAGKGLSVDVARRALATAAETHGVRIGWTRHPAGSDAVIAAVETLFLEGLDAEELSDAVHEVGKHAERLAEAFAGE